eukprot:7169005-Prymnesium_polylepis.1
MAVLCPFVVFPHFDNATLDEEEVCVCLALPDDKLSGHADRGLKFVQHVEHCLHGELAGIKDWAVPQERVVELRVKLDRQLSGQLRQHW